VSGRVAVKKKGTPRKTKKRIEKNTSAFTFNREVLGICYVALAVFMSVTLIGLNVGSFGNFIHKVLNYALGKGAFLLPLYLFLLGIGYIVNHERLRFSKRFFSLLLLFVSLLSLWHVYAVPQGAELLPESLTVGGGLLGGAIVFVFTKIVGRIGTVICLVAITLAALVLTNRFSLSKPLKKAGEEVREGAETAAQKWSDYKETRKQRKQAIYDQETADKNGNQPNPDASPKRSIGQIIQGALSSSQPFVKFDKEQIEGTKKNEEKQPEEEVFVPYKPVIPPNIPDEKPEKETEPVDNGTAQPTGDDPKGEVPPAYVFPPLSLLDPPKPVNRNHFRQEMETQGRIIEKTLRDFGVKAELVNVTKGPSVTRYEVSPAPGVKVNRIQNLSEDIALKLAVSSVRIEPIPGKAAIGIEVPSRYQEAVTFRSIVDCDEIRNAKGKLCVGLGKDISGKVIVADLSKMPHLLIAGATGSGKSVCINTIIASLLYRARPDEVKLILVDPKVVELTNYNGIPHLLTPVVTGPKQAASALHWAVVEMERRYSLFAKTQVRKMDDYNAQVSEGEKLPFIVIIIDELSDLMMVAAVDVEDAILRLAQKARAAGIHLILATQRPSVDVLTGTIKANIPSRIAFAVSSNTDSRTILDMSGAENLLGRGDMLYFPTGANKPTRVQGAFITDDELARIVNFIKSESIPTDYQEEVTTQELSEDKKKHSSNDEEVEDELFEDALRLVVSTHQASSSMLQRKFRIGYTRAARLVDTMEEKGIVGPAEGSKPRTLIMSEAAIADRFFNKNQKKEADLS
jgi:S-DNA-T family DNA segregation ATPase FtsK/SpoIIIE